MITKVVNHFASFSATFWSTSMTRPLRVEIDRRFFLASPIVVDAAPLTLNIFETPAFSSTISFDSVFVTINVPLLEPMEEAFVACFWRESLFSGVIVVSAKLPLEVLLSKRLNKIFPYIHCTWRKKQCANNWLPVSDEVDFCGEILLKFWSVDLARFNDAEKSMKKFDMKVFRIEKISKM